ncbi:MAG: hypothetical protein ACR2PT_22360 [Endozoicomonas sp.]
MNFATDTIRVFLGFVIICNAYATSTKDSPALVEFSERIYVEGASMPCMGVLIKNSYIATSPRCRQGILRRLNETSIDAILINNPEMKFRVKSLHSDRNSKMLLNIQDNKAYSLKDLEYKKNAQKIIFLEDYYIIPQIGSRLIPVLLHPENATNEQGDYLYSTDLQVAPGSPVLDKKNEVVCIIHNDVCKQVDFSIVDRNRNLIKSREALINVPKIQDVNNTNSSILGDRDRDNGIIIFSFVGAIPIIVMIGVVGAILCCYHCRKNNHYRLVH